VLRAALFEVCDVSSKHAAFRFTRTFCRLMEWKLNVFGHICRMGNERLVKTGMMDCKLRRG